MKSRMAMEDCRAMLADGLNLQPEDIVRLNALALAFERAKGKSPASPFALPRVAAIAEGVWFREPTIGHELWLAKAERWANADDFQTLLALNAYALSRDPAALPDGDDRDTCRAEVEKFVKSLSGFMTDQILAAIDYARSGLDETAHESPAPAHRRNEPEPDDVDNPDIRECVAVGVLRSGQAALLGVSEADLLRMTRREADAVIRLAYAAHKIPLEGAENDALRDYYRTLDEIRERLERERDEKQKKAEAH
jgi:hypothetical protein